MVVHKYNLLHNIGVIRSICEKYNKKLRLASKVTKTNFCNIRIFHNV